MSTLVRIKRPLNEDPLDAVVLNYKRKKVEDSSENIKNDSVVVKFAGTVKDIQEDVSKLIKQPTKIELKENYKKHHIDIIQKLRQENQEASKDNRLKVVNSFRSNDYSKQVEGAQLNCTIVDIETDENESVTDLESATTKNKDFVYDLYYTNSDDFGDDFAEFISAYPLSDGLIYGTLHDGNQHDSNSDFSDDSNAENNSRNDYPDESDVESVISQPSITEDDMIQNMNRLCLPNDDLSSDEYDVAYGYENQYEIFKKRAFDDSPDSYYDESYSP